MELLKQGRLPNWIVQDWDGVIRDPDWLFDEAVKDPDESVAIQPDREDAKVEFRYDLTRLLGGGKTTEVYLTRETRTGREVALKVLKEKYVQDEGIRARFERGAKNAAPLSHPNVVATYDLDVTDDGAPYAAMEYVQGGTLADRIREGGPLPAPEAARLAARVAAALGAAHAKGVIHRDIRPHNVLLTEDGTPKVSDFGIARTESETVMTVEGEVLGTAHYVSPEQVLGQPLGSASDLYSLGVALYEMLTGVVPFDAGNPFEVAMKHVREQAHPPRDVDAKVPDGLNAVVVRLLSKNPRDRHPDALELARELWQLGTTGGDEREEPREDAPEERRGPGTSGEQPDRIRVPDLAGKTIGEARGALVRAELGLGLTSRATSGKASKDRILGQDPAAGTEVAPGTPVGVTVGTGPGSGRGGGHEQRVRVPDLVARRWASAAKGALSEAGLSLGSTKRSRSDAPKGTIIGQEPAAGTEVRGGSLVNVVISGGRLGTWVPVLTIGAVGAILIVLALVLSAVPGVRLWWSGSFEDDFSSSSYWWPETDDYAYGNRYASAGENYRMFTQSSTESGRWTWPGGIGSIKNVSVQVEADPLGDVSTDASWGVVCRASGNDLYTLGIGYDGAATITKYRNGEPQILGSTEASEVHYGGVLNTIQADCDGSSLALSVNGEEVLREYDTEFISGAAGLYVSNGGESILASM